MLVTLIDGLDVIFRSKVEKCQNKFVNCAETSRKHVFDDLDLLFQVIISKRSKS